MCGVQENALYIGPVDPSVASWYHLTEVPLVEAAVLLDLLADQRSCQVSQHLRHENENEKILGVAAAATFRAPHLGHENEQNLEGFQGGWAEYRV